MNHTTRNICSLGLFVLSIPVFASCNQKDCEPRLCINDHCDDEMSVQQEPGALPPLSDFFVLRYSLPIGVQTDESIRFRIEKPCSCTTFTRAPVFDASKEGIFHECKQTTPLEVPVTMPSGGACWLTVSTILANDHRTVTIRGNDEACKNLKCQSNLPCQDDLDTASDENSSGSPSSTSS